MTNVNGRMQTCCLFSRLKIFHIQLIINVFYEVQYPITYCNHLCMSVIHLIAFIYSNIYFYHHCFFFLLTARPGSGRLRSPRSGTQAYLQICTDSIQCSPAHCRMCNSYSGIICYPLDAFLSTCILQSLEIFSSLNNDL